MLIREVKGNIETKKFAYVEYSDENPTHFIILGDREFDTFLEALEWSKGFAFDEYEYKKPEEEISKQKPIHVKPSFYSLVYEDLKKIAKEYGYNCVLHGSLNRDLDIICIPWKNVKSKEEVLMAFCQYLGAEITRQTPEQHLEFAKANYGRYSYIIILNPKGKDNKYGKDVWYLDLSFTPISN